MDKEQIENKFRLLQDEICLGLEKADGKERFREDIWQRPGGGGGRSRIISQGEAIEKGGVNFSAVYGETPAKILETMELTKSDFFATGVSIVLHPVNPWVPIIHMNIRYFEMDNGVKWFGGGIDLTPHYIDPAQAAWFHQQLKVVCDRHDLAYYSKFKTWADQYFYLRHRQETRGIGGIFFDHLKPDSPAHQKELFDFVYDIGGSFLPVYLPLLAQNRDKRYSEKEKNWQQIRRGRYVEFNLVWDRGTKFGLETDGRTESILMSLPPIAAWIYDHQPAPGSPEQRTLELLQQGIDWTKYQNADDRNT